MDGEQEELTKQELKDLEKKVSDWVKSPKGQKTIQEAIKNSEETIKDLREKRRVDLKSLCDPFTI